MIAMAVNKIIYGGRTLIDLSGDTVTADKLLSGYTAHAADGTAITGTAADDTVKYVEQTLTEDQQAKARTNIGAASAEEVSKLSAEIKNVTGASLVEPADDDIPKVFIDGEIPTTKTDVLAEMKYISKSKEFHAYIKIKCQGTSSMSYPKKNFSVKLYSDETRETALTQTFRDWGYASNKFVLKSNYIDHSHARNIVSANLWSEIVGSRSDYASLPEEMRTSPRNGAVDGFPIKVYANGTYQGIYTWNIGKDAWMWGMDKSNDNHVLLCGETNTDGTYAENACNFRSLWGGADGTDWSVEVGTNSTAVKDSLNALISCVMNTTDDEFRAQIGTYLDLQSAIDYYLFQYAICGLDGLAKNMLLATYDLTKWYCGAYDLDSTFGLWWNGGSFVSTQYQCPEQYQEQFSLLWERIEAVFYSELKARYTEIRSGPLSLPNIYTSFERFMDTIGLDLYEEDLTIYTEIPSGSSNNIKQIRDYIRDRLTYVDEQIAALDAPAGEIPCTGITLDQTELTFTSAGSQTLTATVTPENTTDTIVWDSSDASVATVSNGVVAAVGNGSATITAACGEYSATCAVSVRGINAGTIPAEYEQVEYIESNGTQYIDTGVSGGTNAAYEIKFDSIGAVATNWEQYFCGDKNPPIPKIFASTNGDYIGIGSSSSASHLSFRLKDQVAGASVYAYAADGSLSVDGVVNSNIITTPGNGWGDATWYVFNSHGEPTLMSSMKLYYLKMWTDGVLVRDFVPAKRVSDGVYGLYDRITSSFFWNAGEGAFAGSN